MTNNSESSRWYEAVLTYIETSSRFLIYEIEESQEKPQDSHKWSKSSWQAFSEKPGKEKLVGSLDRSYLFPQVGSYLFY